MRILNIMQKMNRIPAEHNTPKLDKNIKITVEQKYLFSLPSTFSYQASGAHLALTGRDLYLGVIMSATSFSDVFRNSSLCLYL